MRAHTLARMWLLAAALGGAGCDLVHSPTCKDSPECVKQTDGGAPVCYDMRCVQCAYDVDCPSGKVCNAAKTCEGLEGASSSASEGDAGAESSKWEGSNWDECAKVCKEQDCIHNCDTKYPRPTPSGSAAAKPPPPKK